MNSSNTPLVSILIPLYNAEAYVAETLDSVLAQTYTNWECIVVDDHSTDDSARVVETYCQKHPDKIKLYTNPRKGACAARNVAFEKSLGEFIQYLDADDLLGEDKIEKQVEVLAFRDDSAAFCDTYRFKEDVVNSWCLEPMFAFMNHTPAEFFINLWGGKGKFSMIQTSAWLVPRRIIVFSWNEDLTKDQDGEFFAHNLLLYANTIVFVPVVRNYYRVHQNHQNISSLRGRIHIQSNLLATKLKAQYLFAKTQHVEARQAIATQFKHVAVEAWPLYKDLTIEAMKYCNQYGGSSYVPALGGRLVEMGHKLLGWKISKWITFYLHHPKLFFTNK